MQLRFISGPENGSELVRNFLLRAYPSPAHLSRAMPGAAGIDIGTLEVKSPHMVYGLGLGEIVAGADLGSARPHILRYLIHHANEPIAAAEVHVNEFQTAVRVANVYVGPFVQGTVNVFNRVALSKKADKGSYEMRFLRMRHIYVAAVWLKSDAGGDDIVVPLAPAPSSLGTNRTYSVDEFMSIIQPIAKIHQANGLVRRAHELNRKPDGGGLSAP